MKPDPQLRVFICASRPKKRWSVDRLVVEIVKLDSTGSNTDLKIDGLAEKLTLLGRYAGNTVKGGSSVATPRVCVRVPDRNAVGCRTPVRFWHDLGHQALAAYDDRQFVETDRDLTAVDSPGRRPLFRCCLPETGVSIELVRHSQQSAVLNRRTAPG